MVETWKQEYGVGIQRSVLSVSKKNRPEARYSRTPDTGIVFLLLNLTVFRNLSVETSGFLTDFCRELIGTGHRIIDMGSSFLVNYAHTIR
jgi:hypothetical protein